MNTIDLLSRWSVLSLDEIQQELDAGKNLMATEQLFGADAVATMRNGEATRSFSGPAAEAVVLLPGLMGSLLSSVRGVITSLWLDPAASFSGAKATI